MKCPSCQSAIESSDWICAFCDYILNPSVLDGPEGEARPSSLSRPPPKKAAWRAESQVAAPEAMILGDGRVDPEDFKMVPGAGLGTGGRPESFLFYTAGATSRVLRPDAVPELLGSPTEPQTPYEDFVLSWIDGKKTVREIQKNCGLAPQEVTVSLLTLLDKGLVKIGTGGLSKRPSSHLAALEPTPRNLETPAEVDIQEMSVLEIAQAKTLALKAPETAGEDFGRTLSGPRHEVGSTDLLPPVSPEDLGERDAEEVTEAAPLQKERALPEPKMLDLDPIAGAGREPDEPETIEQPLDEIQQAASGAGLLGSAGLPLRAPTAPPRLGMEFLKEVREPSVLSDAEMVVPSELDAPPGEEDNAPLAARAGRAAKSLRRPKIPPERLARAEKLYQEALKDRAAGNVLSARMNVRLARTFDPENPVYLETEASLEKIPIASGRQGRARELYDRATAAEKEGRIEEAIALLEQGLTESREPPILNRLAVLMAMKKREFVRAQELIQEALRRAPGNQTYEHNLRKILQMAAELDLSERQNPKRKGLLDLLRRK